MSGCCDPGKAKIQENNPCRPPDPAPRACSAGGAAMPESLRRSERMVQNCLDYARAKKAQGHPVVGILCEFTPRELIMAGGGVPACLCGGSAATIPAAEECLPANLCPLIKSTYGYHALGNNPFLEMADLVVAETTCDGKKKMYELMAETRPMFVLELPQKQGDPQALERWTEQMRRLQAFLERRWETTITRERLLAAIRLMNRERALRRRLAALARAERPSLTGRQLLALNSIVAGIPEDLEQYERILAEVDGWPTPEAPVARVLLTGVPTVHGAERVVEIIEQTGARVVCMENCTGLKPILEDVSLERAEEDPVAALAEKYYHLPCSVMTPNDERMDLLRRLAEEYRPDCVIELIWQACLTYDVEARRTRRLVEEELGLPYLRVETDYSTADSARIAMRVEALLETVGARRRTKACRS
jgi:benzoyl-CoA reductase/2-hydroxyglutaryl-CoA dehydratase subunit BcrC/BadD/HgdB